MKNDFKIKGIPLKACQHLFSLDKAALAKLGAVRQIVDKKPGYPCRLSLEDAEIGEEVILFPYMHHNVDSPYRASGPVFIRKGVKEIQLKTNEIPELLRHRLLSLRAYNDQAMMIDARTVSGKDIAAAIETTFDHTAVTYIQLHNAGPGCYNCQVERIHRKTQNES